MTQSLQDDIFAFYLQKTDLTYKDKNCSCCFRSQSITRINVAIVYAKIQVKYLLFGICGCVIMRENRDRVAFWLRFCSGNIVPTKAKSPDALSFVRSQLIFHI